MQAAESGSLAQIGAAPGSIGPAGFGVDRAPRSRHDPAVLDIQVVNLERSPERRAEMQRRLDALGARYEFYPAVDGRATPHELFARYDESRSKRHRRVPLGPGELGCWASHFLLWQRCVREDRPLVVLEDDLEFAPDLLATLDQLEPCLDALEYVRLGGLNERPFEHVATLGTRALVRYRIGPAGTQGYVITPRAARAFLAHADSWYLAVDDYMDHYWLHGVECYALHPLPVVHADVESDIPRTRPRQNLGQKLAREGVRLTEQARRCWHNLRRDRKRERAVAANIAERSSG